VTRSRYAPEAITIGRFTSKSDVWSFGVTLWEMFSHGQTPYRTCRSVRIRDHVDKSCRSIADDMTGSEIYYALKHGKRLEQPVHCSMLTYQRMLQCWEWDESKRPAFHWLRQILSHDTNDCLAISHNDHVVSTTNEKILSSSTDAIEF
jgi:focal adhesion kinase 1